MVHTTEPENMHYRIADKIAGIYSQQRNGMSAKWIIAKVNKLSDSNK